MSSISSSADAAVLLGEIGTIMSKIGAVESALEVCALHSDEKERRAELRERGLLAYASYNEEELKREKEEFKREKERLLELELERISE